MWINPQRKKPLTHAMLPATLVLFGEKLCADVSYLVF